MANKFTEKAAGAVSRAVEFASELGHTYVGSEHILLGLLDTADSVGAKLLSERGATLDEAESIVANISGTGDRSSVSAADMTPRTKKIIETSAYISARVGHGYIGTEHLLCALLTERGSAAVSVLSSMGFRPPSNRFSREARPRATTRTDRCPARRARDSVRDRPPSRAHPRSRSTDAICARLHAMASSIRSSGEKRKWTA